MMGWLCFLAVALPPIGLMLLDLSTRRHTAAALAVLAGKPCPACGQRIGDSAARTAHADTVARNRSALKDARGRGELVRLSDHWRFTCRCGRGLEFSPSSRTLLSAA